MKKNKIKSKYKSVRKFVGKDAMCCSKLKSFASTKGIWELKKTR